MWKMRHSFISRPASLGKVLQSVQWGDLEQKREAHRLLQLPRRVLQAELVGGVAPVTQPQLRGASSETRFNRKHCYPCHNQTLKPGAFKARVSLHRPYRSLL